MINNKEERIKKEAERLNTKEEIRHNKGERRNNNRFGRGISIARLEILIDYHADGEETAGASISILNTRYLNVGEYYNDANGALNRRQTMYIWAGGYTNDYGYDVATARAELGVADWRQESSDNDSETPVFEGHDNQESKKKKDAH